MGGEDTRVGPRDVIRRTLMSFVFWILLVVSALLEVGGDAFVRKGLRGSGIVFLLVGCGMLSTYGVVVNLVTWDFSKLLGIYVAIFAVVSVLIGRFVFGDNIPHSTWLGLVLIILGAFVIQVGDYWK